MSLIPHDPFRLFQPIWEDMERYFRRARGREDLGEWLYRVDVDETPTHIIVTAEIPGIEKKEDLNIQVDDNKLTIQGEIKRLTKGDERITRYTERYYGKFTRTITLPASVKSDGAHASYKNGVLELSFPKDTHPAARRIDVDFH